MYLEPSTTRFQMALKADEVTHVSKMHDRMDFGTQRTKTPGIQLRHYSLRTTYGGDTYSALIFGEQINICRLFGRGYFPFLGLSDT